ncbi:glycosyl hydrolase family 61-domain-containing protein [Auriculariales sp. MPI-PUGE-AT-0066]|nr:glycosyl hydrolase family 61-domain-containing protein [Auriculariales sp. MPI-PUGE-AT-0066]
MLARHRYAAHPLFVLLLGSTLVSFVAAHGSVSSFSANGQKWTGPYPGSTTGDAPVRIISTLEPITDINGDSMSCGPGANPTASVVAEVTAGSDVIYEWRSGAGTNWVHRWGPVMLYAFQCPGDASECAPPSDAQWFLINAAGADPQSDEVKDSIGWIQDRFHAGMAVPARIPVNMPNGDFLLRHEVIALHNAQVVGGAEHYISCTQIRVSGGSDTSARDAGAELVAIPGVYKKDDPGLLVNVFDSNMPGAYKMPGPAVFGEAGSGTPTTGKPNSPTSPAQVPLQARVTCRVRKSKKPVNQKRYFSLAF